MNRVIALFLFISMIVFFNYEKIEMFMDYYKAKTNILISTNNLFTSKKQYTKQMLNDLHHVIDEENTQYNNEYCKKYSKFYKLNYDDAFVDKQKTYVVPETYTKGGVYSVEQNKCVHPNDPLFSQQLDCNKRLTCNSGIQIPGSTVLKNNTKTCVYDCI
jgi:hypothetical protein